MVLLAGLFGAAAGVVGTAISSLASGLSTGPVIVLCISAIAAFSLLFGSSRGIVWAAVRRRRHRQELAGIAS
jgi:manganese/zinc/iron transport system permease protein